jgi:nitrite reductase/ring-hydroxylating ferredoxin subunit
MVLPDSAGDNRDQDPTPSRREFLAKVIAVTGAVPLLASCMGKSRVPPLTWSADLDVSSLKKEGDSLATDEPGVDGARVLVVRGPGAHFHALSLHCTHQGCPVAPPVDGILIHGPAIYGLGKYESSYNAQTGQLTVSFRGRLPIQSLGYE